MSYLRCVFLGIVVSNTYSVVLFGFVFPLLCTHIMPVYLTFIVI